MCNDSRLRQAHLEAIQALLYSRLFPGSTFFYSNSGFRSLNMAQKGVLAITGTGGVAIAVARRLGSGRVIAIGSRSRENLQKTKETLESEGHDVKTFQADMRDQASIENFAKEAAALGPVEVVVHTSGISPSQADSVGTILETNLLGTMYVIDAFEQNIAPGGSLVVVSSMGAHMVGSV